MKNDLNAIPVFRKSGHEKFILGNHPTELNLLGFWQWAGSDLTNNAYRGMLAEYIVACDLGINLMTRIEWDAYDLLTESGIKIEVKSAAYLQSWKQSKPSRIEFNICPTNAWNTETNSFCQEKKRQADIYVFALLKHLDKKTVNPLDLDQWDFFVLPTLVLDSQVPHQQKIGINGLLKLNPIKAKFGQIKETIGNFYPS
ncbi:MAG: hypothetical protein JSS81_09630 [Acidobacteria bacterium]|nr:hypothetical protein [Acidobacteriota bacterium]